MSNIDDPNELNKLLSCFNEKKSINKITLLANLRKENLSVSIPFGIKHENTISFGLTYELIKKKGDKYFLAKFGEEFLDLGDYKKKILQYQLSNDQKKILNERIFSKEKSVINLIKLLKKHNDEYSIPYSVVNDVGVSIDNLIDTELFEQKTEMIRKTVLVNPETGEKNEKKDEFHYLIVLNKKYDYLKQELEKKAISLKKLMDILKHKQKIGKEAEKYVLKDQKDKVKQINKKLVGEVRQVSEKDVSLGYDIKSIDEQERDKFIEVKGTVKKSERQDYFITPNELAVADAYGKKYYLALVSEVENPKETKVRYIPDPIKTEFKSNICKVCHTINYENLEPVLFQKRKK